MPWPKGKPRTDLTGLRFGRLLVSRQMEGTLHEQCTWECFCDCGNRRIVPTSALKTGNTTSCGCYTKERQFSAVALPSGEAAFNRLYKTYRDNSKKLGRVFELSKERVRELTSMRCTYCGCEPSTVKTEAHLNGVYVYNGIDRINSEIGYINYNVTTCCKRCNRAKDQMGEDEFASWVDKIYTHWARKYWDLD